MNDDCQAALEAAFGAEADAELIRAVREGVLLGDDLIENTLFLRNPVGKNYRGLLRRAGVIHRLHTLCQTGELPFAAGLTRMEKGTWHCIEIFAGTYKAHVVRTDGPLSYPKHSETRQDERLVNQPDLFEDNVVPFRELLPAIKQKYAWLTFGADRKGNLQHLVWAMPTPEGESWLAHINVLRRAVAVAEEKPAAPDKKQQLKFRGEIEDALKKQIEDDKQNGED